MSLYDARGAPRPPQTSCKTDWAPQGRTHSQHAEEHTKPPLVWEFSRVVFTSFWHEFGIMARCLWQNFGAMSRVGSGRNQHQGCQSGMTAGGG